jgi:poly-D-alanine transfer protein DltD
MKHPIPNVLVLLCVLISAAVQAQNPNGAKPALFNNYPGKIICSEQELGKVFTSTANQDISLSFSDNFIFSGKVTSNVVKYTNLQTAIIKSPVFGDAVFVLSKITNTDKSTSYVGRIINKNYFDGYELKKDASNNYQLIKIETDKVIPDCSHK